MADTITPRIVVMHEFKQQWPYLGVGCIGVHWQINLVFSCFLFHSKSGILNVVGHVCVRDTVAKIDESLDGNYTKKTSPHLYQTTIFSLMC